MMISGPAMNHVKQHVRALLPGLPGVRGVGFGWDASGNQVLNVDVDARTDSSAVERRLTDVETPVRIRKVSGTADAQIRRKP
jgi:hypothetical protein